MGTEAQGIYIDDHGEFSLSYPHPVLQGCQTATTVGEKIYIIGKSSNHTDSSITIQIFTRATGKWTTPAVLGIEPDSLEGHLTLPVNGDRILVVRQETSFDECIWFLEVDTPFVKEQQEILGTDVVAWSKGVVGDTPKPIVISGPSGVGKGTLISLLLKAFPSTFGFSVSHTTRLPREKEVDGVHYHFTERSKMEKDIREGKFLETASVHGNLYGTSLEAVETVTDTGKRCILDIDVQGARSVRSSSLEAIFIFIAPPSFAELEKRLRARGTETEEQIQKRLRNARTEIEQGQSFGIFDHILVNNNLDKCFENLKKILDLDGNIDATCQPCEKSKESFVCHSISRNDGNLVIHCGYELGAVSDITLMLDASSPRGGAPGRTRGLKISESKPLAGVMDGI